MRDCNDFPSDIVVQSVHSVRVDKAIAGPQTGLNRFLDFAEDLEERNLLES